MLQEPDIEVFVFDAYGTVFDVHSVAELADALFPGQGEALSRLWRAKQVEYMFLRTLMDRYVPQDENTRAALVYAGKALGLALDEGRLDRLMEAYLHLAPFPDAPLALEALAGKPRAILSVGTPAMLEAVATNAGLRHHFDRLISVDPVRVYKPHPRTYGLVLDAFGVEPAEVAFVTANYFDVAGAKAFGFRVFWVNRAKAVPDELGLLPDHVLTDLTELSAAARAPPRRADK